MPQPSLKRPCPFDHGDSEGEEHPLPSSGPKNTKRPRQSTTEEEGKEEVPETAAGRAGLKKTPLIVLARKLTPWLWVRVRRLVEDGGFDAHVIQDVPLPQTPKEGTCFPEAMRIDRLHFVPDEEQEAAGYKDINKHVTHKSFTAWERGLFWATQRGRASSFSDNDGAAWADRVFFAEDDAQWCDAVSFGSFCRYVLDTGAAVDLYADRLHWSLSENPAWPHWGKGYRFFKREHLASVFVPFCCMSQSLLQKIREFATKHKTLCFLEVLFASLAKEAGLKVAWFSDMRSTAAGGADGEGPAAPAVVSRWRPEYEDSTLQRMLQGHRCPPSSAHFSSAAASSGDKNTPPLHPVLFHPIKRKCAFWAPPPPKASASLANNGHPELPQPANPSSTRSSFATSAAPLRAVVAAMSYEEI
jgi:hypothetical protein